MTAQEPNAKRTFRIRFARTGPAAWIGHLDLMRVFERALRRACLPAAFTQGFNPHPVMTFALPLGVGVETRDDYAEIGLSEDMDPALFARRLSAALPEGLAVSQAQAVASEGVPGLMARVRAAEYRLEFPGASAACRRLLDRMARPGDDGALPVEKKGKDGVRTLDLRPLVLSLDPAPPALPAAGPAGGVAQATPVSARESARDALSALVAAGSRENLRPDLLLDALVRYAGVPEAVAGNARILRTGLFVDGPGGTLVRPM